MLSYLIYLKKWHWKTRWTCFLFLKNIYKPPCIWGLTAFVFFPRRWSLLTFGFSTWVYVCYLLLWIFSSDLLSVILCLVLLPNCNLLTILYFGCSSGACTSPSKAVINEVICHCYSRLILSSHNAMFYMAASPWIKTKSYSYLAGRLGISR